MSVLGVGCVWARAVAGTPASNSASRWMDRRVMGTPAASIGGRYNAPSMGTWGTALYSDDLAADLRGDFTDAAGDGLSAVAIVDRLAQEHAASVADADEG